MSWIEAVLTKYVNGRKSPAQSGVPSRVKSFMIGSREQEGNITPTSPAVFPSVRSQGLNRSSGRVACFLAMLVLTTLSVRAADTLFNVSVCDHNFDNNTGSPVFTGCGVLGNVNDTNWNALTISGDASGEPYINNLANIHDSRGYASLAGFNLYSYDPDGAHNTASITGGNPDGLIDHYAYVNSEKGGFVGTFTNLGAYDGQPFILVFYAGNDSEIVSCGGTTRTNAESVRDIDAGDGGIYLTFRGRVTNGQVQFMVDISDGHDYASFAGAQLRVHNPALSTQILPVDNNVSLGDTATFTALAVGGNGAANSTYQWYRDGTNILAGQTNSTLVLTGATTNLSGNKYSVVVNDGTLEETSPSAVLTVANATLFNVDINAGTSATYNGAAVIGSAGNLWNGLNGGNAFNGTVLFDTGGKSNLLVTASLSCPVGSGPAASYDPNGQTKPVPLDLMGDYACGAGTLNELVFTFGHLAPFNGQPYTLVVYSAGDYIGEACNITVNGVTQETSSTSRDINDGLGICYVIFTGVVSNGTVTITVDPADDPNYSRSEFAILNGAQLQILNPPVFVYPSLSVRVQPARQAVPAGSVATFVSTPAGGSGSYSYQWYQNAVNLLPGQTNSILALTNTAANRSGCYYDVVVSDGGNRATSGIAVLDFPGLSVRVDPMSAAVLPGSNTTFSALVSSARGNVGYQWYRNGSALYDQTNHTLLLEGVTTSMTGDSYAVLVKDGSTNTAKATGILYAGRSAGIFNVDIRNHHPGEQPGRPVCQWHGVLGGENDTNWNEIDGNMAGDHRLFDSTGDVRFGVFFGIGNSDVYDWSNDLRVSFKNLSSFDGFFYTLAAYTAGPGRSGNCSISTGIISNGTVAIAISPKVNDRFLTGVQLQILKPLLPLSVQTEPATNIVGQGDAATFTADPVGGTGNYTYQWYQNGTTLLPGQTNATLVLAGVTTNLSGCTYRVVVDDGVAEVTSSNIMLAVGLRLGLVDVQFLAFNSAATPMSDAAVIGGAGDIWNQPSVPGIWQAPAQAALNFVNGTTPTGLTLTCSKLYAHGGGVNPVNNAPAVLTSSDIHPEGGTANVVANAPALFTTSYYISSGSIATMTLSGFKPNTVVSDLYIYSAAFESANLVNGVGGAGGNFTVGITTLSTTDDGVIVPYTSGDNYVHFKEVRPDGNGNVMISWTSHDPTASSECEGFQLRLVQLPEAAASAGLTVAPR